MKNLIPFALLFAAIPANAADLEIGAGMTSYKQQINGIWYQEGFPYKLDLIGEAWFFGVSHKFNALPRIRAEYLDLGYAKSNAYAVPEDANYNPNTPNHCNGECLPLAHFVGKGKVTGIVLSFSPEFAIGPVTAFVEAGVYFYRPTYHVFVTGIDSPSEPGGRTHHFGHKTTTEQCPIIGVGIRFKNVNFSVRYMETKASGDGYPAIYNGAMTSMLRISF